MILHENTRVKSKPYRFSSSPHFRISGEDALAEGIAIPRCDCEVCARGALCPADASAAIMTFGESWDSIHGPGAFARGDWVFAYTFRLVKP